MSRFLPYNPDQAYLLPPSVKEVLPSGHLCFFLQQMMARLDLEPLEQEYSDEGGQLYHPALMLSVWLYAYARGVTSGRELERRIGEDLPLRYLAKRVKRRGEESGSASPRIPAACGGTAPFPQLVT